MKQGMRTLSDGIRRLASWFFGAPFRNLPSEYGDPVPPELEAFEDELVGRRHGLAGKVPSPARARRGQTKPKRG